MGVWIGDSALDVVYEDLCMGPATTSKALPQRPRPLVLPRRFPRLGVASATPLQLASGVANPDTS